MEVYVWLNSNGELLGFFETEERIEKEKAEANKAAG
jgi:hypothetical protein